MNRSFLPQQQWFRKPVHVSWLIAWASTAFLVGAGFAPLFRTQFTAGSEWLVLGLGLIAVALIRRVRSAIIVVILAGLLLGFWRGGLEARSLELYKSYYGKSATVRAVVSEDVSYGSKGDQRMRLKSIYINDYAMPGTMWVSLSGTHDIKRGDIVYLQGLISEGFGNIPAAMFRAEVTKVERPYPGDVGRRVRDWFAGGVERSMSGVYADLGLAYLVGQQRMLPEELTEQFRTTGLIHAVVASGYHLTVLVMVVHRLFAKASKYLRTMSAAGMIVGFIAITGLSPSMSRAGLISGLSLLAWYYGRVIHPLVLLSFAAAITVWVQPAYLWGDIGWYLSFLTFAGVIILAPLLHDYFWGKDKQPGLVRTLIITTCAAQILALPLTIYVFGYYSPYALLANILVVPLVPLVMLLTFVSGVVGLVLPMLAEWVGWPARVIMEYMIRVVEWIANLPQARTELTFSMAMVVASYAVIVLAMIYLWRRTGHDFKKRQELL